MSRPWIFALLLLAFCGACLPLSFSQHRGNYDQDEASYYYPAVLQMREHWPALDLKKDTLSATAPGYLYVLAGLSRVIGTHLQALRAVTTVLSAATLLVLLLQLGEVPPLVAIGAVLPLATCNFFIKSSAWVVTDNAALFFVCLGLFSLQRSLARGCASRTAGVWAAAAIFMRQLHAWLIGPLVVAALCAPGTPPRSRSAASALWVPYRWLQLVLPTGVLLWLVASWHGLVPPAWQQLHASGLAPVSAACALVCAAGLGGFYLLSVQTVAQTLRGLRRGWSIAAAVIGLGLALAGPSNESWEGGRWGGYFWWVIARTPLVGQHSVLVVLAAPLGAAILAVMAERLWSDCGPRPALLWSAGVGSWLAACAVNRVAFERYFDPPLLVFLICWLAWILQAPGRPALRARWPLAVLTAGQLIVSVAVLYWPLLRR